MRALPREMHVHVIGRLTMRRAVAIVITFIYNNNATVSKSTTQLCQGLYL